MTSGDGVQGCDDSIHLKLQMTELDRMLYLYSAEGSLSAPLCTTAVRIEWGVLCPCSAGTRVLRAARSILLCPILDSVFPEDTQWGCLMPTRSVEAFRYVCTEDAWTLGLGRPSVGRIPHVAQLPPTRCTRKLLCPGSMEIVLAPSVLTVFFLIN